MKKTLTICILSFIFLILLQLILSFILSYTLFDFLNIKEKEDLSFIVQLSIDLSFIITIFGLIKILKINLFDNFSMPSDKSLLTIALLAVLIYLLNPLFYLELFFKNIDRGFATLYLPAKNETLSETLSIESLSIYKTLRLIIIGPILEEIYYRKILLKTIAKKYKYTIAILISSLLFTIGHLDFNILLPAFFVGIILGIVFIKSKNIVVPILLHSFFNILFLFTTKKLIPLEGINMLILLVYPTIMVLLYFILKKAKF